MNRLVSLLTAILLILIMNTGVIALDTPGDSTASAVISQASSTFNVTVPMSLPINVGSNGSVTSANSVKIINSSSGPVKVTSVSMTPTNGWTIVNINKDMSGSKVGLSEFGFKINNEEVAADGSIGLLEKNWPVIAGGDCLNINYDAKLSVQKSAVSNLNIASILFTVDWDAVDVVPPEQGAVYSEGNYNYTYSSSTSGWAVGILDNTQTDYMQPLETIQGKPVNSYSNLFSNYPNTTLNLLGTWNNSKVTDMMDVFHGCKATVLDFSHFYTENVTNMKGIFTVAEVTFLDLSTFNTSKVTDMGYMFRACRAEIIDLSNFDTSNVLSMQSMFAFSSVKTLDLSNFDTSNVTDMNYMFCRSKAAVLNVSNFDTSKVTNMDRMFQYAVAKVLDVSSFDTSKVINMNNMFMSSAAEVLDLRNFNTVNVTNMDTMLARTKATVLDVSGFNTSNVTTMARMFNGSAATILDCSKFDTSNVIYMNGMFNNAQVNTLNLNSFNTTKVIGMSAMFYASKVITLDLSSFDMSNVTDRANMFTGSLATTGFAKTESDAAMLNAIVLKPEALTFLVK